MQHFVINTYFVEHNRQIDIFCLHIFLLILSYCRIDVIIFGGNWLRYLPWLFISQVLSVWLWAIIKRGAIIMNMLLLYIHYYFVIRRASVPMQCVAVTFKFVSINSVSSKRLLRTLALFGKLILLSLGCMFLICSASRICRFCLLIWCSNIVFSLRIFRNSVVGHECFLNAVLWNFIKKVHCKSPR